MGIKTLALGLFSSLFTLATNNPASFSVDNQIIYQNLLASQKQSYLWNAIVVSKYQQLPDTRTGLGIPLIFNSITSFLTLKTSFDHASDIMPEGRKKIIHTYGTVAPVRWIPARNSYSGIFQTGGFGLARLSIAGDPNLLGIIPGMALKIFVDGQPSVNLHVMHSLDGQGKNNNFFANSFTNNIPKPTNPLLYPLIALFAIVQNPPTYLPLDHFAKVDRFGKPLTPWRAPLTLIFKPSSSVSAIFPATSTLDFRTQLAQLRPGIFIYDIYATGSKPSQRNAELIGKLVLDGSFVASDFGDEKLFFQHHK